MFKTQILKASQKGKRLQQSKSVDPQTCNICDYARSMRVAIDCGVTRRHLQPKASPEKPDQAVYDHRQRS